MKKTLILLLLFLSSQICFGLKPDPEYLYTPDVLDITFHTNKIITDSEATLNSWLITAEDEVRNGTTLILCYGDMGNMSYWIYHAKALSQVGYDVLLFDYRGFGKSANFEINPDYLYYDEFAEDLISVIKWAKVNLNYDKLGLLSFSMGTIMSSIAIQTESVDFLIGEGFVLNPKNILSKIKELKGKDTLLPESSTYYNKMVKNLKLPILLFSGTQDVITSLYDSEKAISNSINGKSIAFEGNHLEGFLKLSGDSFGQKYIEEINNFLASIK